LQLQRFHDTSLRGPKYAAALTFIYRIADFSIADYWVLTIAGCTYLILADHKYQSTWIQDHKYIIWLLPWVLSILWAVLGLVIVGYGDIGACELPMIHVHPFKLIFLGCWFTSDRVRLLVNFIPRWLIIIAILGLYLRLYFIIHKAHNRFISFDDDTVGSLQASSSTPRNGRRQTFNISSSAEGDNEAERSQHTRIGRASPVLRRVCSRGQFPATYLLTPTDILSDDGLSPCVFTHLDHSNNHTDLPVYRQQGRTIRNWHN
jgi:hypothetical protein